MVKQINVGEALEQFKNEVVPLMSLAELEALQKFLKVEISTREAQSPETSSIRHGARLSRGQATRTGSSGRNVIAADVVRGVRSCRKGGR